MSNGRGFLGLHKHRSERRPPRLQATARSQEGEQRSAPGSMPSIGVQYPSGGTGMFKEGDIRAYDPERDAKRARQPRRARATGPRAASRSRYALDPAMIAAGKLPDKAPIVTSVANPHYQKRFDELHKLSAARDWAGVRDYKVSGSNSYSKMVARYRQDLLAVHAAWPATVKD